MTASTGEASSSVLSDGDWNVVIPPELLRRADRLLDGVDVCSECERIYSALVEDHYVEREVLALRRRLVHATRYHTHPDQLRGMQENLRITEEHVRRHHRSRRDYEREAIMPRPRRLSSRHPTAEETVNFADIYTTVDLPSPPGSCTQELGRLLREAHDDLMREAYGPGGNGGGGNSNAVAGGGGGGSGYTYVHVHHVESVFVHTLGGGGDGSLVGTKEAQERGLQLLKDNLTPAQLQQYEAYKHFEVIGCDTGTRYRIRHGRQMNIDVLDKNGSRTRGICFLPTGNLVAGDCMLDQKIALETMENHALSIANPTR